jgi:aspartate dehydrogenase
MINDKLIKENKPIQLGIAGLGAVGSCVASYLLKNKDSLESNFVLHGICDSDAQKQNQFPDIAVMDFEALARNCDVIIEALPSAIVPNLAKSVFQHQKTLLCISSSALLIYPEIIAFQKQYGGRIIVPSGALAGLDGVAAMRAMHYIESAEIISTKPPLSFKGAPYFIENPIDLNSIKKATTIFQGSAEEAAVAFPANINVAASLALASGVHPSEIDVTIVADPKSKGNSHRIRVRNPLTEIKCHITNTPSLDNAKSSALTAYSIIAWLEKQSQTISIG